MMVCNNTYMLYALLNGTDFTSKATPGTWVTLNIHGVHLDGTESVVNFYLVNIEDTDIEKGILTTWQKVDLSSLGTCTGMYFTMDCSPNFKDDYGMSVPTYFCIDQIVVND